MIGREAGKHSEALKRLRRLVRDRRERLAESGSVTASRQASARVTASWSASVMTTVAGVRTCCTP